MKYGSRRTRTERSDVHPPVTLGTVHWSAGYRSQLRRSFKNRLKRTGIEQGRHVYKAMNERREVEWQKETGSKLKVFHILCCR